MIKACDYEGFIQSCAEGFIEIVDFLCKIIDDVDIIKSNNFCGFRYACEGNSLCVVKFLFETFKDLR